MYPGLSMPKLPNGSDEDTKAVKEECSDLLKEIYQLLEYGNKKELFTSIMKTKEYVTIIIDILTKYLSRVNSYKMDHEMYEFNDIAMLAIKVLKDNPSICDEVKYSLKEILVDEYQDTNDIQETFISLISNNNVYMVGDIKQSIYRFRNANPYIFKNKYDAYANNDGGIKIDLVKNFRSRDVVLDNINEVFDLVMDNTLGGAEYWDSHRMVFGNTTYINEGKTNQDYNLEVLEYELDKKSLFSKEEVEIFTIAKDIKDKVDSGYQVFDKGSKILRKSTYNDYVILMDRTTNFELYKQIFEYVGVPLTLYKDETLNNSNDIYTIKNLIELIIKINNHEYDTLFKYDFISVARSNLYEMEDNDIFTCFLDNSFKDTDIFKAFNNIDINVITPVELIKLIIDKTNYYEKMINVGDINNGMVRLQKLIEMASSLSNYGYDIYDFVTYLNKIVEEGYEIKYSISNEGADSVKIMTIHKSKGLEYHICYFSGLYKGFNISDIKDSFIYNNKYGFITPYFEEGINYTFYKELLKNDYMMEEISEKIRLFYVALTRAKEKMIMLLPKKEVSEVHKLDTGVLDTPVRYKYRSLADIMYSVRSYLSKYYHTLDIDDLNLTKDYLLTKDKILDIESSTSTISVNELDILASTLGTNSFSKKTHDLIDKETRNNMDFGTKVHEYLEHANFKDYQGIEDKFIDSKIRKLLDSKIMTNIKEGRIFKELEFMYDKDDTMYHGIIDLMVEYDNYIDIIDYKLSNVDSKEYIDQLNGYREYILTKTGKPVNLYLYSIITGEIKEI
jgi:ATP-dependent helicase/nuclease subunit A